MFTVKSKFSKTLDKFEDPGDTLDYSYENQLRALQQVKKSVADIVTAKKRLEIQRHKLQDEADKRQEQARVAISQGLEDLARDALNRKQSLISSLTSMDVDIEQLAKQQDQLVEKERNLSSQVAQFRTKKEVIKAQYNASKAQVEIASVMNGIGGNFGDTQLALQRAQDKVSDMQARAAAVGELESSGAFDNSLGLGSGQDDIDRQLGQLTMGTAVEAELAQLKAEQAQLPAATGSTPLQIEESKVENGT